MKKEHTKCKDAAIFLSGGNQHTHTHAQPVGREKKHRINIMECVEER